MENPLIGYEEHCQMKMGKVTMQYEEDGTPPTTWVGN
jgi:hypothetical protein